MGEKQVDGEEFEMGKKRERIRKEGKEMKITKSLLLVLTGSIYGFMLFVSSTCNAASYPTSTATPLATDLSMNQYKLYDMNDVITKGPWVDARIYNGGAFNDVTINAAITAIGTNKNTLLLAPGTWTISNNVTVPSNINLRFEQGAVLSIAVVITFTINGPIDAPIVQVFDGSGSVVFGQGAAVNIYIEWFGLSSSASAATNDTAISKAMSAMPSIGGGTLLVAGWNYAISSPISITKNAIRLIGPHHAYATAENPGTPKAVFVWNGNAGGTMMQLGASTTGVTGGLVKGISIDGGATYGKDSITGIHLGSTANPFDGGAWQWAVLEDIAISRTFTGLKIGRTDVTEFKRIVIQTLPPIVTGSVGIDITSQVTGSISDWFRGGVVQGFDTLVKIGNTLSGISAGLWFEDIMLETYLSRVFDIRRGESIHVSSCYIEGTASGSSPPFKIGDDTLGIFPKNVVLSGNAIRSGTPISIRVEGCEGLIVGPGNQFIGNGALGSAVFWNEGNGVVGGEFVGNAVDSSIENIFSNDPNAAGSRGFVTVNINKPDFGSPNPYRSSFDTRRLKASLGPALTSGDFSLSAGWGSTATVSGISGTDSRGRFTVNSSGTGQSVNPTITVTFKDLAWQTEPFAIVVRNGGAQPSVMPTWTTTTTGIVITFPGTPVAGESYVFEYIVLG